jgi:hypothetical protein
MSIVPSVGRKVWFYAYEGQLEPADATVIKVMPPPGKEPAPDTPVNLLVVNPDSGETRLEAYVHAGSEQSFGRHYRWMPYQKGQAAKAEAAAAHHPV